jgi:hypothetical protein
MAGAAPFCEIPGPFRFLASSGNGFVFENKVYKSFYKVNNPFVHNIVTSCFICFVSLGFCTLGLVKAKHTQGKSKSTLLSSSALLSMLFDIIKMQGSIQMYSQLLMRIRKTGSFPASLPTSDSLTPPGLSTHP